MRGACTLGSDEVADAVVIGAGIQGLSASYNLALAGVKSIFVLETHSRPGLGSSGRSGSMLMKSRENAPKIALSLYSYSRFMSFEDEFGESLILRKTGFINAVPNRLSSRYKDEHAIRVQMGVPSSLLTPEEMRTLAPGLYVDDLEFGLYCPDDAEISADQIMNAYHRRGKDLGVQYCFNEHATGLVIRSSRIVGVTTNRRTIPCGHVVNAAGADAAMVASWANVALPISNMRRSLYFGVTDDTDFHHGPMVEDAAIEWYYRPLLDGAVLVGMGLEPDSLPTDGPNLDYLPTVRAAAEIRAPGLADFLLTGGSSGIRSLTPDNLPIIGPVREVQGLINSCGWGGEGIMHSPAGGTLVAEWVTSSPMCGIDRDLFLLERFANNRGN